MDSATDRDRIETWLTQEVDPAFRPLREKIAASGTPVRWETGDWARTLRVQFGATEIVYTITLDPDSHPITGQLLFQAPQTESRSPFLPAFDGQPRSPDQWTGRDLVNNLIDQYGQWLRHILSGDRASQR